MRMELGKLPPSQLTERIFRHLTTRRSEVLLHSSLGEDSSVIDFGDKLCVVSTDPITGAVSAAGWLAVHVSANDVASNGAEPVACLLTILAPPTASEDEIERIMKDASRAANELNIEIVGGHTEVTAAVNQMVLSATVMGKVSRDRMVTSSGAQDGDMIVITKGVGLEGTAILAQDQADYLAHHLSPALLSEAQELTKQISVVKEGMIAAQLGASAMHDVTEGGLLGALYEMASCAQLGFILEADQVPILPSTHTICQLLGIDPLRLISSGCLLIATGKGDELVSALAAAGITSKVIGRFHRGEKLLRGASGQMEIVAPPQGDELWTAMEVVKERTKRQS